MDSQLGKPTGLRFPSPTNGDVILAPESAPFLLAGHPLTPDTFSQCSWQQGAVGQLVFSDLSNFTQDKVVLDK